MKRRPILAYRPVVERFDARLLLSAGSVALPDQVRAAVVATDHPSPPLSKGFLAYRVTQTGFTQTPPFKQVLVQDRQPVPGQMYNVLQVSLKNGTARTFDASSGFTVRLNNQTRSHAYPILKGDDVWKPQEVIVFYVLTKKYYPVSFVSGGFQFNLGGRSSTLVPGPSGIFQGIKYSPENFPRTLDWIVAFGPGAQGGNGTKFGLPNTAVNTFVSGLTRRRDFGGHF